MAEKIYRSEFVSNILSKRRINRINFVLLKVKTWPGMSILDIGCDPTDMSILDIGCGPNGRSFEDHVSEEYQITGIDILEPDEVKIQHPKFTYYKQDAIDLSMFDTKSFDLAISIGMMEHICDHIILRRIAREIDRVSKQYIIIVPWKWAWIEPHFKFPFFQLFPYKTKVLLTRFLNLHNLKLAVSNDPSYISKNYQWFTSRKWREIFVGSHIYLCPTYDTIAIVKHGKV